MELIKFLVKFSFYDTNSSDHRKAEVERFDTIMYSIDLFNHLLSSHEEELLPESSMYLARVKHRLQSKVNLPDQVKHTTNRKNGASNTAAQV